MRRASCGLAGIRRAGVELVSIRRAGVGRDRGVRRG